MDEHQSYQNRRMKIHNIHNKKSHQKSEYSNCEHCEHLAGSVQNDVIINRHFLIDASRSAVR